MAKVIYSKVDDHIFKVERPKKIKIEQETEEIVR